MRAPAGLDRGETGGGGRGAWLSGPEPAGLGEGRPPSDVLRESPPRGFSFFWMGLGGPFLFVAAVVAMTATLRERLIALIEPCSARMGYELVELEYRPGAPCDVRIFIDRPAGVGAG